MKTFSITFFLTLGCFNSFCQSVSINSTGAAPNASSMLDIQSNNKGLLIPRVALTGTTDVTTISSPANWLMVFNTATAGSGATAVTPGTYYWDGSKWVRMIGSSDAYAWKITGNDDATSGTHFLGTTNAQALDFRTGNTLRFRVANGDQVHAMALGTAALPFYSWSADPNTGIFSPGADQIDFSTNGTARFRIPNANQVHALSTGTAALPFYSFSADPDVGMYRSDVNQLSFSTNGAERVRINDASHRLTFNGSATAPAYSWTTDTDIGMYRATTNALGFSTAGVERMRIGDYNGSIGIGRVPCCGSLGGPIVDVYEPMEVGNDEGSDLQARIGYFYGPDVAVEPEGNFFGYVGAAANAWYRMHSYGYINVSERNKKREITSISQNKDLEDLVMRDIEKINPSFYYYNGQNQSPISAYDTKYRPHYQLGVIIDESPDYILDETFKGVDIYAVATLSLAGVKHNYKKIQEFEGKLNQMTINDFGTISENNGKVTVKFSNEFISQLNGVVPVVNITPVGENPLSLRIVEKNNNGFVVVNDAGSGTISFDWMAIAKVSSSDVKEQESKIEENTLKKIHLTPEEKQKAMEHYSKIKATATPPVSE